MIFHCFLQACVPGTDPLYAFLPLALAGFATAFIFAVHWSVVVISGGDQDFQKHSISLKRSRSMKQIVSYSVA